MAVDFKQNELKIGDTIVTHVLWDAHTGQKNSYYRERGMGMSFLRILPGMTASGRLRLHVDPTSKVAKYFRFPNQVLKYDTSR